MKILSFPWKKSSAQVTELARKTWSPVSRRFSQAHTGLVIELSKTSFKAAVVQRDAQSQTVSRFFSGPWEEKSKISDLIVQESLEVDEIFVILTRDQVTIRNIELPTTDPAEIRDIVTLQAAKQTPFTKDEILVDYKVLGSPRENYSFVLMGIVQKTMVESLIHQLADQKKIFREAVLGSECLTAWTSELAGQVQEESFAVIDCGDEGFDLCVFSKGQLIFTGVMHFDAKDLASDNWQRRFYQEVLFVVRAYLGEDLGPTFRRIFLLGEPSRTDLICQAMAAAAEDMNFEGIRSFVIEPMPVPRVAGKIQMTPDAQRQWGEQGDLSYLKVLGLVVSTMEKRSFLNFLPRTHRPFPSMPGKIPQLKNKERVFFVLMVAVAIFAAERLLTRLVILGGLGHQLAAMESVSGDLQRQKQKVDMLDGRIRQEGSAVEVLAVLHEVIPQQLYVSSIIFEQGRTLTIRGTTITVADVMEFTKVLQAVPEFQKVQIEYFNKRAFNDREFVDFEVKCRLSGLRPMKTPDREAP